MADPQSYPHEGEIVMGWIGLILLIVVCLALLWWFGMRGGMLKGAAAALLLAASGYALQGRPGVAAAPASAVDSRDVFPLTDARHAFFGHFTRAEGWLRMSEALARDGKVEDSVGILQNAVKRYPGDPQLWIGLGNALVDHAQGLTPPAELAYQRAAQLVPGQPGPPFFYGLALARSGDNEAAVTIWKRILARAPQDASWRPLLEQGVAALSKPNAAPRRQ